jgi:hypothetical protein
MARHITTPTQLSFRVSAIKLGATTIRRIKAPGSSSQSAVTVLVSKSIVNNIGLIMVIWLDGGNHAISDTIYVNEYLLRHSIRCKKA